MNTETLVGPYRVLSRLGRGGMGEVWLAEDTRLHRQVALKTVRPIEDGDAASRANLMREARAAAALNHPHIATVHDVLEDRGEVVIIFEYVEGETLQARITRGRIPAPEAVEIGAQIAKALIAAHAQGIVHRDLKPANIIIAAGGHVKVLDFGIARILSIGTTQTLGHRGQTISSGGFMGTPSYAAPEQLISSAVDERADLYALGVVLFEMISGQRPFLGNDPVQLASSKLGNDAPPLSSTGQLVPVALEEVVAQLLERDRDRRTPSAVEALTRLRAIYGTSTTGSLPVPKSRWLLTIAASIAIVALGGFGLWTIRDYTPPPQTVTAAAPVIAVLPLANVSGDVAKDFIGTGIAESLISSLAAVPTVTVLSRASVTEARARVKDSSALAKDLGATYLVEGSVQESGGQLRITLNLVKSDKALAWGDTVEGRTVDVFALQSRLAALLTAALNIHVSPDQQRRMAAQPTQNSDALNAYWQGRALLERRDLKGSLDGAAVAFSRAIALDPRFALAHAALGETFWLQYVDSRDSNWARQATDEGLTALRLNAEEPVVRYTLAVTLAGTGKSAEAVEELRHALALQPNFDDARRQLGQLLAQSGRVDDAVVEYRRAIALRPAFWGHYSALGGSLLQAGRYPEAIEAFQKVIELQPDNYFGYQQLGVVQHNLGNLEDALRSYRLALERRPNAQAYSNIGAIHHRRGQFSQAVEAYQDALRLRPNSHITNRNMGDALARMGQVNAATIAYEKAMRLVENELKINPQDATLLSFLAVYAQKAGQSTIALDRIVAALSLTKTDWQVAFRAAEVHALAGRSVEALAMLRLALARGAPRARLEDEDDFRNLRPLPEYRQLVAQLPPSQKLAPQP